jgi:hypothetical protein
MHCALERQDAVKTFISMLLSFLPAKYREALAAEHLPSEAGIASGIVETLVSVGCLIHGYFAFMDARLAAIPTTVMVKAAERMGETLVMGFGSILMIQYLLQFTSLGLIFLALEGIVRCFAAFGGGEVLPSFPLKLVAVLHDQLTAEGKEVLMGRRIRDEVEQAEDNESLEIASCRPKPWNTLTTISHDGELYQLAKEKKGSGPRPFVYVLRKKSPSSVIRGIYNYDPDEVTKSRKL